MKKPLLALVVLLVFAATGLISAAPAHGAGKSKALTKLALGTANSILGNTASKFLTNLGVFDMIGLGGTDPVLDAKLDQIIMQLQVVQTDISDLKTDVAMLTSTVVTQQQMATLQNLIHDMDDAQARVTACMQQVSLVSGARGTDATDAQMHAFALQMVGRAAGPCDLAAQFQIIHDRIVTDQTLGSSESAFYSLLAQVASHNGVPFEQVASHFVQYSITQRGALELVRSAYTALGEADNLDTVFTKPPSDFLRKLRDEEVAFLQGADTFITAGQPPYDTSPAALADAIVQRLEGVSRQATTYSVSIRDDATGFSPKLSAPGTDAARPVLAMGDTLAGAVTSYYGTADKTLTIGVPSCVASPNASEGFGYVRPMGGTGSGFKLGSTCKVHLERHLLRNLPTTVAADWTIGARYYTPAIGAPTLMNAATLEPETAAEALALAGGAGGRSSGRSALVVAADPASPDTVTLAIDLPGAPATPIRVATAHAFAAAGTGAVAKFRKVPFGPRYPDRFALALDGKYLWIGADGFAARADSPIWFNLETTADGHVELVYDGGVVYVNDQLVQVINDESPDDLWATAPNLAVGQFVNFWSLPADGVPRARPTNALAIYPPCLTSTGQGVGATFSLGLGGTFPSSECSDNGLAYVAYYVKLFNQDAAPRAFKLALAGQATWVAGTAQGGAGIHCWIPGLGSPNDHLDTDFASVSSTTPSASTMVQLFDPQNRGLTIPAQGSLEIWCQILDARIATPQRMTFSQFIVQPCKGTAGGTCGVFP
jgi:hypothetical protein